MSEAAQQDVVAFLSDPATHGPGITRVETITTHASVVFLAGDRAVKLKRAVKYSYLDFSTLALREEACRAELALNRRTAPELYLDTIAVTREQDGRLALGGAGQAVDWVVLMKRFPQEALFSHLAETGQLTPDLMRRVADRIAAFHRDAGIAEGYGGVEAVAAVIRINDENLRRAGPPHITATEAEILTDRSRAAQRAVADLLERRRKQGRVRRCHGDLHLGNICLIEGRPTLFDCIEFSALIACIDVLYDLAFLLMDLGFRGHATEAAIVFNRYLDVAPESDGLKAMPLFLSLRAWVRAHVLATAAGLETAAERRNADFAEARRYFDLALDLLEPRPPRLLAIGGLSGTGKSSIAAIVAGRIGAAPAARVLRSDVVRKRHFGLPPEHRLPDRAYSAAATGAVYTTLLEEAQAAIAAGCSVIIDAVAARPEERAAFAALAERLGVRFDGIWLEAPPDLLLGRIAARRDDASDADAAVLHRQLAYDLGAIDWRRIDASAAAPAVAATIVAAVSR